MSSISTVTLLVRDLSKSVAAYQTFGYRVVGSGVLQPQDLPVLHDVRLCGCAYTQLLLHESSDQRVEVIEYPDCQLLAAFESSGWAALEILVSDLMQVEAHVKALGLEVIGKPQALSISQDIRAMQVIGCAGELIYFTEQLAPVAEWPLPIASALFDQCFIVVLCTHDLQLTRKFYAGLFNLPMPKIVESKVLALSRVAGCAVSHRHHISAMSLGGGHWLEFDQWHHSIASSHSELAAGIFSIGIHGPSLSEQLALGQRVVDPRSGQDCLLVKGPSGERLVCYQIE